MSGTITLPVTDIDKKNLSERDINLAILNEVFVPLPPMAVMDRLLVRVAKLMGLIDELQGHSTWLQKALTTHRIACGTP